MFKELKVIQKASKGFKVSIVEGCLSVLGSSLIGPMVTPLLIRLGADAQLLGIFVAINTALTPPMQIVAALLLDKIREKRLQLMTVAAALSRSVYIVILCCLLGLSPDIKVIMLLLIASRVFGVIAGLAWTDIMADLTEPALRGRLFAIRNSILGLINILSLTIAKFIYDYYPYPQNYIYAFSLGIPFMLGAVPLLYKYGDPKKPKGLGISLKTIVNILKRRDVLKDASAMAFWNSAVGLVGAIWAYHMFTAFKADESWFTSLNLVGGVTGVAANIAWGRVHDKFGPKRVFFLSGMSIVLVPILFPHLPTLEGQVALQVYSSFTWAGFNLASFNYAISYTETMRHVYIAVFNSIPAMASSLALYVGAVLYEHFGVPVFYLSGIARMIAAIVLYKCTVDRGVAYEDLKLMAHLYPLIMLGRGIVVNVYAETIYALKVIYSVVTTAILIALLVSMYILALKFFTELVFPLLLVLLST